MSELEKYLQQGQINKAELEKAIQRDLDLDKGRIFQRQSIPSTYPAFTKHAAFTGITFFDINLSVVETKTVTVQHNLGYTPLAMVFLRPGGESLVYSNTTNIYPLPQNDLDTGGHAVSEERFYTTKTTLVIERQQIIAGAPLQSREFFTYFIFADGFKV